MKQRALNIIASAGLVLYPLVIYLGMTNDAFRGASLLVVLLVTPAIVLRLRERSIKELSALAWIPLLTASLLATGALLNRSGFVLATPVVINAVLLSAFGATLFTDAPMIERFARLQDPTLTDEQVRWCRAWTLVWCCFFLANAIVAASLARWAPLELWTLYNSLISYILIGLLFAFERVARWVRFERTENSA